MMYEQLLQENKELHQEIICYQQQIEALKHEIKNLKEEIYKQEKAEEN